MRTIQLAYEDQQQKYLAWQRVAQEAIDLLAVVNALRTGRLPSRLTDFKK